MSKPGEEYTKDYPNIIPRDALDGESVSGRWTVDGKKKDSNPKDAVGVRKVSMSCVSAPVMAEVAVGMSEGARKYGRHNYRIAGVRASVYYDATLRHLMQWWEGEDLDPDSGMSHVTKAITSLVVLRDSMIQDMLTDDRPPKSHKWIDNLNASAGAIIDKYPNPAKTYTETDKQWSEPK